MCGFCLEQAFIGELENELRADSGLNKDPEPILLQHYAQESNNLKLSIEYICKNEINTDLLYYLHCRVLEEKTFPSDIPISNNALQNALHNNLNLYCAYIHNRFSLDLIQDILPSPAWGILYCPDFLFNIEKRKNFLRTENLITQSRLLLKNYCQWWLKGKNKKKNELSNLLKIKGVADPIEETTQEEWEKFYDLFPAVYFALAYLASMDRESALIEKIALHEPEGVPDFPGCDLWLQRRALIHMIRKQGSSFLIENLSYLRPELIFYSFLTLKEIWLAKARLITRFNSILNSMQIYSEFYENGKYYIDRMVNWS